MGGGGQNHTLTYNMPALFLWCYCRYEHGTARQHSRHSLCYSSTVVFFSNQMIHSLLLFKSPVMDNIVLAT